MNYFSLLQKTTNWYCCIIIAWIVVIGISGCNNKYQINDVKHVVVIYLENHSFDNLYGQFDGANGLSNATKDKITQVDSTGNAYEYLPPVLGYMSFPTNLPKNYFNIDQYVAADMETPDVLHAYYEEQMEIDGGKMDKYALYNSVLGNSGGLTMGYYKTNMLALNEFAKKYTLCDNFFHSAFGGSFLNHMFLIAAAPPSYPDAPVFMKAVLDSSGKLIQDGQVTSDGYLVNTCYTVNNPHPVDAFAASLVPNLNLPTIGDRLNDKGISWAWYSGGWDDALAGNPAPTFQYHHQPFAYFANYADGAPGKKEHLKDEKDFIAAAKNGTLPAVSFVKPLGMYNEHPGYSRAVLVIKNSWFLLNRTSTIQSQKIISLNGLFGMSHLHFYK